MTAHTYGTLPYPGFSWAMSHHMGIANEKNVYQLLLAANMYRSERDPVASINEYMAANRLLTRNVRSDTGQMETWRDYQQMLPELGLIVSTRRKNAKGNKKAIDPTPLGLAFVENSISYDELVTLQALRLQYPNGYKTAISSAVRKKLSGTKFANAETLADVQAESGVEIRPGVLIWRVLRELRKRRQRQELTLREIQRFLVPCYRHEFTMNAVEAICEHRAKLTPPTLPTASREVQEWRQLLRITPLFTSTTSEYVRISTFGNSIASEIDDICRSLEKPESFWKPTGSPSNFKVDWFSEYGSLDVSIDLIPNRSPRDREAPLLDDEIVSNRDLPRKINLQPFDPAALKDRDRDEEEDRLVKSAYKASRSKEQLILHNRMVSLVAQTCSANGGKVFHDPKTVDLLVDFRDHEFLVEVKSVTPANFITRLRLALGQLLHYDYLRSMDSQRVRRKVVAVAARVPATSWSVPFVEGFLDWDLLSLGKNGLKVNTSNKLSRDLFAEPKEQTLFDVM